MKVGNDQCPKCMAFHPSAFDCQASATCFGTHPMTQYEPRHAEEAARLANEVARERNHTAGWLASGVAIYANMEAHARTLARHEAELLARDERIAYLEKRLEIEPDLSEDCDGIACRDETIKLLDARIAAALEREKAKDAEKEAICAVYGRMLVEAANARDEALAKVAELEAERADWQKLADTGTWADGFAAGENKWAEAVDELEGKVAEMQAAIVEAVRRWDGYSADGRIIIKPLKPFLPAPQPDPLVEALKEIAERGVPTTDSGWSHDANLIRDVLGLEIKEK